MTRILPLLIAAPLLLSAGAAAADAASEAQLQGQLAQAQAELARYKDGFERANAALAQLAAERQQTSQKQVFAGKLLDYCQAKNVYLISVGEQILAQSKVRRPIPEPFTQIMRVRLENQQQEYEDRIRAGHFDPRLDHPAAQPAAAEAVPAGASTPPATTLPVPTSPSATPGSGGGG